MHVYWAEIFIDNKPGNEARDLVKGKLGISVEGDSNLSPAILIVEGKRVGSELVVPMLRQLAGKKGLNWQVIFKESRAIQKRAYETIVKAGATSGVRRVDSNTLQKKSFYVIVGCGAAAVVNHTTLRQTPWGKKRVGDRQIVHVGFEDPWSHYNTHEMGQFPQILGLPGYDDRPELTSESTQAPHSSTVFGRSTSREMTRLHKQEKLSTSSEVKVIRACVLLIQPRGISPVHDSVIGAIRKEGIDAAALEEALAVPHPESEPGYRLLLADKDRKLSWLYAGKIDLCTGTGKPRSVDETMVSSEVYESVRTRLWEPVETWDEEKTIRPILSGTEALYAETSWAIGKRYFIMGGGGVGVNMVERARDTDKWVDWVATRSLHPSFPIGRNDILLRGLHEKEGKIIKKEGKAFEMGDFAAGRESYTEPVNPRSKKWRFGQGVDLEKATLAHDLVHVKLKGKQRWIAADLVPKEMKALDVPARIRDYDQVDTELTSAGQLPFSEELKGRDIDLTSYAPDAFDRLIRCSGQDIREVGQAEKVAVHLELDPLISPTDGRMVGLQTADESVRVLGGAGTGNPVMVSDQTEASPYGKMDSYHRTLPEQGRIQLVGFVFSSLNIATANHYFDPKEGMPANTNVNTMSMEELQTALGDHDLVRAIIELRRDKKAPAGFLTIDALADALDARLADLIIADVQEQLKREPPSQPVASGWEKQVRALGLEALRDGSLSYLQTKLSYPFPAMVVKARDNAADRAALDALVYDVGEQLKTTRAVTQWASNWEKQLRDVGLKKLREWPRTTLDTQLSYPLPQMVVQARETPAPRTTRNDLKRLLTTQYRPADKYLF